MHFSIRIQPVCLALLTTAFSLSLSLSLSRSLAFSLSFSFSFSLSLLMPHHAVPAFYLTPMPSPFTMPPVCGSKCENVCCDKKDDA